MGKPLKWCWVLLSASHQEVHRSIYSHYWPCSLLLFNEGGVCQVFHCKVILLPFVIGSFCLWDHVNILLLPRLHLLLAFIDDFCLNQFLLWQLTSGDLFISEDTFSILLNSIWYSNGLWFGQWNETHFKLIPVSFSHCHPSLTTFWYKKICQAQRILPLPSHSWKQPHPFGGEWVLEVTV